MLKKMSNLEILEENRKEYPKRMLKLKEANPFPCYCGDRWNSKNGSHLTHSDWDYYHPKEYGFFHKTDINRLLTIGLQKIGCHISCMNYNSDVNHVKYRDSILRILNDICQELPNAKVSNPIYMQDLEKLVNALEEFDLSYVPINIKEKIDLWKNEISCELIRDENSLKSWYENNPENPYFRVNACEKCHKLWLIRSFPKSGIRERFTKPSASFEYKKVKYTIMIPSDKLCWCKHEI